MTVLDSDLPFERDGHDVRAGFSIHEGERHWFVLQFAHSEQRPPPPLDHQQAFDKTEAFWREWVCRLDRPTQWPQAVRRSLTMVKALTSRRTGGIVAAPTTSLPEVPAGKQN
jgi:GH15 family glucan-1,4-alpha-glucosidase